MRTINRPRHLSFTGGDACVVLHMRLSQRWQCNTTTLFRLRRLLSWFPLSWRILKIENNMLSERPLPRSVLYDYPTLASAEDKAVRDMEKSSHWVAQSAVWFFLAQLFPWIMHIPQRSTLYLRFNNAFTSYPIRFFKWKREASKHTAERSVMFLRLFNRVKTDLVHPSMTLWASGVNWIRRLGEWPGYPSN